MDLVGLHAVAQRGIDLLVALDETLAFKGGGNDGGIPVAAIALGRTLVAGQPSGDQGFEFFSLAVTSSAW